jgi:hypothetical protein
LKPPLKTKGNSIIFIPILSTAVKRAGLPDGHFFPVGAGTCFFLIRKVSEKLSGCFCRVFFKFKYNHFKDTTEKEKKQGLSKKIQKIFLLFWKITEYGCIVDNVTEITEICFAREKFVSGRSREIFQEINDV